MRRETRKGAPARGGHETFLARTMRGLSVPALERGEKNRFAATPGTLQQGRELFLTQCAACHGIDGGGKTQMGLNLYPKSARSAGGVHPESQRRRNPLHYRERGATHGHARLGQSSPGIVGRQLETCCVYSESSAAQQARTIARSGGCGIGPVCRIAGLPEMPRGDLCAVAEDADGQCGARSADASRRDHPRSRNQ